MRINPETITKEEFFKILQENNAELPERFRGKVNRVKDDEYSAVLYRLVHFLGIEYETPEKIANDSITFASCAEWAEKKARMAQYKRDRELFK